MNTEIDGWIAWIWMWLGATDSENGKWSAIIAYLAALIFFARANGWFGIAP